MLFILANEAVRNRAIDAIRCAPAGFQVVVKEKVRTLAQNDAIHAVITEYGDSINWRFNGQRVDLEDLKSILVSAFRKVQGRQNRFVIGLEGEVVPLNWRTREFSKQEASEFIDMVGALLAEVEV